jgi:hypothetical protein
MSTYADREVSSPPPVGQEAQFCRLEKGADWKWEQIDAIGEVSDAGSNRE